MPTKGHVRPPTPRRSPVSGPPPRRQATANRNGFLRFKEQGPPSLGAEEVPGSRQGPGPVRPALKVVGAALAGIPDPRLRRGKGQRPGRESTGAAPGGLGARRGTGGSTPEPGGQAPPGQWAGGAGPGAGLTVIRGMLFLPWKDILLLGRPARPGSGESALGIQVRGHTSWGGNAQPGVDAGARGVRALEHQAARLAFPAPPSARPRPRPAAANSHQAPPPLSSVPSPPPLPQLPSPRPQ